MLALLPTLLVSLSSLSVGLAPLTVNSPPDLPVGIGIAKDLRKPVLPNIVVALQHGEAGQGGGHSHCGESGVSGSGVGTTVVHRLTDGDSGRHFVVEQSANFCSQSRFDPVIVGVIFIAAVGVNAAGEVAFKMIRDFASLLDIVGQDEQR